MKKYLCDDGNAELEIEAASAREAAQEYVDGGDWGEIEETSWVNVWVTPMDEEGEEMEDERQKISIAIDPDEPPCVDDDGDEDEYQEHDWQSPHDLLGGLEENPGVQGHGGGTISTEVCSRCGRYRVSDSWAQDSSTGEQGLDSIEYHEADDSSLAWVEGLRK